MAAPSGVKNPRCGTKGKEQVLELSGFLKENFYLELHQLTPVWKTGQPLALRPYRLVTK